MSAADPQLPRQAEIAERLDRTNELLQRMLVEVSKTPSTHAIFVDAGYVYAA
ncbi:NYN domain-containing protein, partial [Streptomyces sp. SID8455]|nr:NYN domain-containing protein [Streptomyces sp. SID8455]